MIESINDCAILNNGVELPWLGFGVFKVEDGDVLEQAVSAALQIGYRSIDTASLYKNERGVGNAIRASGIPRDEIFLTTKVWNDDMRAKRTLAAFAESLDRLGTDYVDLYLVHWPVPGFYKETWKAMEEIYASGRAKAIGVSNFTIHHLEDLFSDSEVVPAVNQIEFHPFLLQAELLAFCQSQAIQVEAWSPLMRGGIIQNEIVQEIANKHRKTTAQIVLRWDLQHGVVTIPKSIHANRIEENADIFDFTLSEADMKVLDALDAGQRIGPDPDNFNF
jgi:diketogulonate reductase-like aldo/keto reductase